MIELMKGGECWLDLAPRRGPKGLVIHVKADPRIEDFARSLGNGTKGDIAGYGRRWFPVNPGIIEVYHMAEDFPATAYTLDAVGDELRPRRFAAGGRVNLSFLRVAGIGDPQGIQLGLTGPFSKPYVREMMADVVTETRSLIRDYVVPIHLNLRITSTEI